MKTELLGAEVRTKDMTEQFSDKSIIIGGLLAYLNEKPVRNDYPKSPKLTDSNGGGAMVMIDGAQTLVVTDKYGNAFEFSHNHETKDLSTWIDPDTFEFVRWARGMDF